jgi:hypothetical protein
MDIVVHSSSHWLDKPDRAGLYVKAISYWEGGYRFWKYDTELVLIDNEYKYKHFGTLWLYIEPPEAPKECQK